MKPFCIIVVLSLFGSVACDKSGRPPDKAEQFKQLADELPVKKIEFWTGSGDETRQVYEFVLYGELAFMRRMELGESPWLLPIDRERFLELWDGFQNLPALDSHKIKEGKGVGAETLHHRVVISGVVIGNLSRSRYSIPKAHLDGKYVAWVSSCNKLIEEFRSEQASTGQPATRPVVEPKGSDKPQPEAEGRPR